MQPLARFTDALHQVALHRRVHIFISGSEIPLAGVPVIEQARQANANGPLILPADQSGGQEPRRMGLGTTDVMLHKLPVHAPVIADGEGHQLGIYGASAIPDGRVVLGPAGVLVGYRVGFHVLCHGIATSGVNAVRAAGMARI